MDDARIVQDKRIFRPEKTGDVLEKHLADAALLADQEPGLIALPERMLGDQFLGSV